MTLLGAVGWFAFGWAVGFAVAAASSSRRERRPGPASRPRVVVSLDVPSDRRVRL